MKITFEGWEDRQPVRGTLQGLDRAQTQAADHITVHLSTTTTSSSTTSSSSSSNASSQVTIKQNPTALKGSKVQVGAAVWDGAYVLAAYLDAQPQHSLSGLRCVELGCGCGLVGLVCARLGAAAVYLTDKPQHLVGPRGNAARNKLLAPAGAAAFPAAAASTAAATALAGVQLQPPPQQMQPAQEQLQSAPQQLQQGGEQDLKQQQQQQHQHQCSQGPNSTSVLTSSSRAGGTASSSAVGTASSSAGVVHVLGLDWEDPAALQAAVAAILSGGPLDLVVASDCIYPDPDGSCPSSSGFISAVTALATPGHTRVLTTFEARSDELRQALLAAAAAVPGGGCRVVQIAREQLPEGFRAEHVELYELWLQQQQ